MDPVPLTRNFAERLGDGPFHRPCVIHKSLVFDLLTYFRPKHGRVSSKITHRFKNDRNPENPFTEGERLRVEEVNFLPVSGPEVKTYLGRRGDGGH